MLMSRVSVCSFVLSTSEVLGVSHALLVIELTFNTNLGQFPDACCIQNIISVTAHVKIFLKLYQ